MYAYKRQPPYSHLDNSPRIDLFTFYGVFALLHIIISENIYRHHTGENTQLLVENVYHLCIKFIRCITKGLTKDSIYGIYIYSLIRVKSYRKNIFVNFKKVLALYCRCAIIKMSKGDKAF